jgi:hypothetical protein
MVIQTSIGIGVVPGNVGSEYVFPAISGSVILSSWGSFSANVSAGSYYGHGGTLSGLPNGNAWQLLKVFALAGTSAEQMYITDTSFDWYAVGFNIDKSASAASGAFSMQINGVTSGYKQNYISYSTPANPNTNAFDFTVPGTGNDYAGGIVYIPRKSVSNNIPVTGNVYSTDQVVWLGGRVATSDVGSIAFDDYDSTGSFTGSIFIWGMRV